MISKTTLLFAVFAFILFSCTKQPVRIVCVGDSITAGYGLKLENKTAYPFILNELLGPDYEVFNFGRSATTMSQAGDFPFWITKEFSNVFAAQPNIITIKLGTNDTKPQNWNIKTYLDSYQAMIDTFRTIKSHPKIILCNPVPVYQDRWGINDSTLVYGVIPAIQELADRNKLYIIDLYTGMQNQAANFPDGVHPNEKGMQQMAKLIAAALKQD